MTGTLINAGAILVGSTIGLVFHSKLPKKITTIVFQAIGLFTMFLGFTMASKTSNYLILIFGLVIGAISGEWINIEKHINRMGDYFKGKLKTGNDKFSEGFVTAFLVFCMGSLTILGSFEEGLGNKPNMLLTKSLLDGFTSIALASAFGIGVTFSIIPLLIYQGLLTFLAERLGSFFSIPVINEMTAVGGLMLIGIGLSMLEIKKIKVINMLPGLLVATILAYLYIHYWTFV
jgi:uncharacterized protein